MQKEFCEALIIGAPMGLVVADTDVNFDPEFPLAFGVVITALLEQWSGCNSGNVQKKLVDSTVLYPGWWVVKCELLERDRRTFCYRRIGNTLELLIGARPTPSSGYVRTSPPLC